MGARKLLPRPQCSAPPRPRTPSRGFLLWRFSYAGRRRARHRLRAAGIRKPSQSRISLRCTQNVRLSAISGHIRHNSARLLMTGGLTIIGGLHRPGLPSCAQRPPRFANRKVALPPRRVALTGRTPWTMGSSVIFVSSRRTALNTVSSRRSHVWRTS